METKFFNVYLGIYEDRHYVGTVFATESQLEEIRNESRKDEDTDRWVSYEAVTQFETLDELQWFLGGGEYASVDFDDEDYEDWEDEEDEDL